MRRSVFVALVAGMLAILAVLATTSSVAAAPDN